MSLSLSNWDYYLVLERELVNSFNYVELSNDNFSTYSVEFAKMLLSICSEFDSVFKDYVELRSGNRPSNIKEAFECLSALNDIAFVNEVVDIAINQSITLKPFNAWINGMYAKLTWWDSYNAVKHDRGTYFRKANLENCLNSLAALLCIEIVSLKCFGVKRLTPVNRLFRIPNKQLCRSLPGQNGQWDLVIDSKELNETSNMRPANLMIVKSVS